MISARQRKRRRAPPDRNACRGPLREPGSIAAAGTGLVRPFVARRVKDVGDRGDPPFDWNVLAREAHADNPSRPISRDGSKKSSTPAQDRRVGVFQQARSQFGVLPQHVQFVSGNVSMMGCRNPGVLVHDLDLPASLPGLSRIGIGDADLADVVQLGGLLEHIEPLALASPVRQRSAASTFRREARATRVVIAELGGAGPGNGSLPRASGPTRPSARKTSASSSWACCSM